MLRTECEYHAIELGEHLYGKMKEKYGMLPNFNIVNDDFMTHDFGDMKFDTVDEFYEKVGEDKRHFREL